jgi:uncharacterized delta-60 repeat protein
MLHRLIAGAAAHAAGALVARVRNSSLIEPLERRQLLSAGQLDPLFGSDGIVQLTGLTGNFADVKALPGGKFLAAGTAKASDGKLSLLLARFNADGKLDGTFGSGGEVITRAGGISYGTRLALLASGKLYVAGDALARFNFNGSLDTTFGAAGIVHFNDGISSVQSALAIQSDGKIVVMHGSVPDPTRFGRVDPAASKAQVSRYKVNGTLDTSFNKTGRITNFAAGTSFTGSGAYVVPQDVAVANGKIIVGVSLRDPDSVDGTAAFGAERINSDGSIDRSFGVSGIGAAYYDEPTGDIVQRVKISPNGTINLLGTEQDDDWDWSTLDANGKNGRWRRVAGGDADASDMVVQSNGKVVMTGTWELNPLDLGVNRNAAYTVRFNSDGSQDNLRVYNNPNLDGLPGTGPGGATLFQDTYHAGGVDVDPSGNIIVSGMLGSGGYGGYLSLGTPQLFHLLGGAAHSGAVLGTDHILRVSGSDSADNITVSRNGSSTNVVINGQHFGPFAAASIAGVHAFGNAGNDVIHVNAGNVPVIIDGGLGNDQLFGGGGANTLLGRSGNDMLTGGSGPNTLLGGAGNDDLRPGVSPSNDIYGGDTPNDPSGIDTVDYSQHTHGVVIHVDGQRDSGASGEHDLIDAAITNVFGSQGNDVIFGGNGELKEALYGLGGSDTIYAGNGSTALYGGDGNDVLYSRNSIADYLDGGPGTDSAHIDALDTTVNVDVFLP